MKVLLAPDSFKGSMSSRQACNAMERGILRVCPEAQVVSIPIADGGEGSVDALLAACGGEKVTLRVSGPKFTEIESFYGILPDDTAVIEMAAASGLPLMGEALDVLGATTMGVGELMRDAITRGCKTIILALGGSATNDGGCGAAAALGARFFDRNEKSFIPVGGTLCDIARVDFTELDERLTGISIIAMCDIDNPLCGELGAAAVFGPQKGATEADIKLLDTGLSHLAALLSERCEIINLPGAGAAGGMGGGAVAFFGARLQMGIETVLDICRFDEQAADADLIFSGEGRIDTQSLRGKAVIGIAHRAKAAGVPLVAVVGCIEDPIDAVYDEGVCAVFSINRKALPFEQSRGESAVNMARTVEDIMRIYLMDKRNI